MVSKSYAESIISLQNKKLKVNFMASNNTPVNEFWKELQWGWLPVNKFWEKLVVS